MKSHDRDYFYKYFSYEGVFATLKNRTFKYTSPSEFNDPFDSQISLLPGVAEEELSDIFYEAFSCALLKRKPVNHLGITSESLQRIPEGISRGDLEKIRPILLSQIPQDHFKKAYQKAHGAVSELMKDNFVFCVTENSDNILMWSHYAENHSGAVLKLRCLVEAESLLCAALKVDYRKDFPWHGTKKEWQHFMQTGQFSDPQKTYNQLILTKSKDWKYEQEWRVVFPMAECKGQKNVFLSYHEDELDSLYLGCKMADEHKKNLIHLIGTNYPWVKIYESTKSDYGFRLDFKELEL